MNQSSFVRTHQWILGCVLLLNGVSMTEAATESAASQPADATQPASQPFTQPATQAATQVSTQPATRPAVTITANSKIKQDAPENIKTYWNQCLAFKQEGIQNATKSLNLARQDLQRVMGARVIPLNPPRPNAAERVFYSYDSKEKAIENAKKDVKEKEERLQKVSAQDTIIFVPLFGPIIINDPRFIEKDIAMGDIGLVERIYVARVVSESEAICLLAKPRPLPVVHSANPKLQTNMIMVSGGFYMLSNADLTGVADETSLNRPFIVEVIGTKRVDIYGEQRVVFNLRVIDFAQYIEPDPAP